FGFVVFRSTVTAETLVLSELERQGSGKRANLRFISACEDFYSRLERHVKRLVERFAEAEIILVSDHSMAVRHTSVNANIFLQEAGFQTASHRRQNIYDFVKSYKYLIPVSVRRLLKRSPKVKATYQSLLTF